MTLDDLDRATIRVALQSAASRIERGYPVTADSDRELVVELRRLERALLTPAEVERRALMHARLSERRRESLDAAATGGA